MARKLKFNVFRYNPEDPKSVPHTDTFHLDETESMTLFIALTQIREEQDPSLQFDFCCRAGICGSCAMVINGRPDLACKTLTKELPEEITLMPLPVFKLIADLSVDTGTWFRAMNEKVGSWIQDPNALEERMDNALAEEIYELERCIECGCCVASCGTANMREDFVGAVALNRIARFMMDPRDERASCL
jgi:fumarate reductase iron-sulfur subunit